MSFSLSLWLNLSSGPTAKLQSFDGCLGACAKEVDALHPPKTGKISLFSSNITALSFCGQLIPGGVLDTEAVFSFK